MGLKTQFQMKMKQREKRVKARRKLLAEGKKIEDYFYNKYYLKGSQTT